MPVVPPDMTLGDGEGLRSQVLRRGYEARKVDEVDAGHQRALDADDDDAVRADASALLAPQDVVHNLAYLHGAPMHRNHARPVLRHAGLLVEDLDSGRSRRGRVAHADVYGNAGADGVCAREERHHDQPLKKSTLPRALLPQHNDLRWLPAMESALKDFTLRV